MPTEPPVSNEEPPKTEASAVEFKLVVNWQEILKKAWSIRFIVVAGGLSGAEIALPVIDQVVDIPRGAFAALSFLATAAAFVSRIVAQKSIPAIGEEK